MLNVSKSAAQHLLKRFQEEFPTIYRNLRRSSQLGAIWGGTRTISGLARRRPAIYRNLPNWIRNWELNWLGNHPIQGSAAVLFKVAGNRLTPLYEQYDAKLIIPIHDSFVFEAPLQHLSGVAELTALVMCEVVRESFPELHPKAEINIKHPECWNKEGDVGALDRWLQDPLAKAGYNPTPEKGGNSDKEITES
jgi:DNA polymerase-1